MDRRKSWEIAEIVDFRQPSTVAGSCADMVNCFLLQSEDALVSCWCSH